MELSCRTSRSSLVNMICISRYLDNDAFVLLSQHKFPHPVLLYVLAWLDEGHAVTERAALSFLAYAHLIMLPGCQ